MPSYSFYSTCINKTDHDVIFRSSNCHVQLPYQYLEEDPKTNRIDDSLQLFGAICSNSLLKDAHLVLLLNKVRAIQFFPISCPSQKHATFWRTHVQLRYL